MSSRAILCLTRSRFTLALLWLVAIVSVSPARAEIDLDESSLQWVPADAAFYFSLMRNKEQYDTVVNSRAFAALIELPFAKSMRASIEEQIENAPPEAAQLKDFFDLPENRSLKEMLIEMLSDEVFVYGGKGYNDLLRSQKSMNQAIWSTAIQEVQLGDLGVKTEEPVQGEEEEEETPGDRESNRMMLKFLSENLEKGSPNTVVGFKLTDVERARQQLDRLEVVIRMALELQPAFKQAFARKEIGGRVFLILNVEGSMISWDQLGLKEKIGRYEDEPGEFDDVVEKLNKARLTVSVGIYDSHLLLFMGDTNEHLQNLGEYELFRASDKVTPLRKLAGQRVATIAYISDEFAHAIGSSKEQIDNWIALFEAILEKEDLELTPEVRGRAKKDLQELGDDVKSLLSKPGAQLGMRVLTKRGWSLLTYDWSENRALDGSKPLTILKHVGGDPIAFVAARRRPWLAGYGMLTKWMRRAQYYIDEVGVKEMAEEQRREYELARDAAAPFWARFDQVTGEMFLPAFEDGQIALVLDSKLSSNQWHAMMPPAPTPLPMFEPAIVCGVSDAKLLKKACSQYVSLINETAAKMVEEMPDQASQAAQFEFPLPSTRNLPDEGAFYYYRIPESAGIDGQIIPNAGLSDEFLTLSISANHARRLLSPRSPSGGTPLSNTDRSLASATHFGFSRLIDTLTPWVDYGLNAGFGAGGGFDEAQETKIDQVHTVLKILQCYRSHTSATYVEGGALVTHSEWHFQDLEP